MKNHNLYFIVIYFQLFFFLSFNLCFSQPGQWTWMKGSNAGNSLGNFGVQGVPGINNEPPALYEACEWTDMNGNFWFYGGLDDISGIKAHNDLWKYDPVTNEWTWMTGTHSLNDHGNFGVQGLAAPTNRPPGLGYAAASWVDLSGDLWMFGGWCDSSYSDLWKYNIASNMWTWVKGPGIGNQPGVYGIKTIPDINNNPGARSECAAAWTDNSGDLWLFGGYIGPIYNDLWRYNIATNTWTWMKGSSAQNQPGHWGVKGVEDTANVPSARWSYTRWKDNSGNLWLYGGSGLDSTGSSYMLGDLWRYNIVTNNWTWMNGSSLGAAAAGHYGAKCIPDSLNRPPHRLEARAAWKDVKGNFWMFGGFYRTSPFNSFGLNDLWKYCVSTNIWTWESGDSLPNQSAVYGTMGVSAPLNKPSERNGSIGWRDNNGHLFLFGGTSSAFGYFLNDLWRFEIDTACAPCSQSGLMPLPSFTISDSAVCEGTCLNFSNQSLNATSYQWLFPGGTPSSDTSANPQGICYFNSGNYNVTLTATNSSGSNTLTTNNLVTVFPPIQFAPLVQHGDTVFSVPGYSGYQWYFDTMMLAGATNYFYVATQNGDYSVQVTDSNGCHASAILIDVIANVSEENLSKTYFSAYFENQNLYITINSNYSADINIDLYNSTGEVIYHQPANMINGKNQVVLTDLNLSQGIYFVRVSNSNMSMVKKLTSLINHN